jgi:glycosyl transferase family 25
MDVRVISLPHSDDRRATARQTLETAGVSFEFFDALDGRAGAGDEADVVSVRRLMGRDLGAGELGCYRSHLALWRLCAAENRNMTIFEDDVQVAPDLAAVLDWTDEKLGRFGYIRLGGHHSVAARQTGLSVPGQRQLVRLSKNPFGAFGYSISPTCARRFVETCSRITRPVDEMIDRFWETGVLPYAVLPYPVFITELHPSLLDADVVRAGWRSGSFVGHVRLKVLRHADSFRRRLFNWRSPD